MKMEVVNRKFEIIFFCLGACIQGFMGNCSPIVYLDACHLKGPYPGQFMVAIAMDNNRNFYPLTYGVVEIKWKASWKWSLGTSIRSNRGDQRQMLDFYSRLVKGKCSLPIFKLTSWFLKKLRTYVISNVNSLIMFYSQDLIPVVDDYKAIYWCFLRPVYAN